MPIAVDIRRALPDEAGLLSALAMQAKAHWGYSAAALEGWRAELRITPEDISRFPTAVAEIAGEVAGFHMLRPDDSAIMLEHLWVRPRWIRRGVGTQLFQHALQTARAGRATHLAVVADPHAAGFYAQRMGPMVRSIAAPLPGEPDRVLAVFALSLLETWRMLDASPPGRHDAER
jgi:GNAT superfamily N-acetyltransferase